eukprot:s347_g25.t1
MPRNPFAGKPNREMTYIKEVPLSTPRRLAQWDMQRTMRGASTPRKNFTPMLPELNQRHRDVLDKSADELAQMMKLFEEPLFCSRLSHGPVSGALLLSILLDLKGGIDRAIAVPGLAVELRLHLEG